MDTPQDHNEQSDLPLDNAAPETTPTPAPEPAPAANPEPTTQSSDQSGQEASAAVLEKAAEDGTPFCEECENAA